jgi:hypothetical protein
MRLVLPKTSASLKDQTGPVFFLAGPILGAGDWQHTACELLAKQVPDALIVNPCRYTESHPLYRHRLPSYSDNPDNYERQTDWEREYLALAAYGSFGGSIIFWLPCQCQPREDGKPYACDTYGELGEWRGQLMGRSNARFVIGAEPGFPGLSVIKRNFDYAFRHDLLSTGFPIAGTLEETVQAGIAKASR